MDSLLSTSNTIEIEISFLLSNVLFEFEPEVGFESKSTDSFGPIENNNNIYEDPVDCLTLESLKTCLALESTELALESLKKGLALESTELALESLETGLAFGSLETSLALGSL
ncbi:hypothetical protein A2U01_0061656, partial [Trifolium medium]|nr:hypothetical protein [Trifolium medium]